jgi:hypothetical protein
MAKENPICPVCGNALKATGADPNMYHCLKQRVYVDDLGMHVEVIDASVNITPEGKVIWQLIEIPPYRFLIEDTEKGQLTTVYKLMTLDRKPWDKKNAVAWKPEVILKIPALMNLPWNDKQEVLEKIKLYLLLS